MKDKGRFITFEGADGVGKSTQVEMLRDYLRQHGVEVDITREPGGEEVSEDIRNILKNNPDIDPITDLLLVFAARREHFVKVIKPKLDIGKWVICDRFYDSTLVYQGKLKGVSIYHIMYLKRMAVDDFEPDATIVLDLDFAAADKRVSSRKLISDAYDSMGQQKYEVVSEGFRQVADAFSDRSFVVSATGNENTVFNKILKVLRKKKWFPRK